MGEVGYNTFKCTYTPDDTDNYNVVTGIEVTIKVTEKLTINIKNYETKLIEDKTTIYITGILTNTSLKTIEDNIETNGIITIYNHTGEEVTTNSDIAKTGMKLKIQTETEYVEYILVVLGDNNGDGEFNAKDLLKFARYLAELDKDLSEEFLYACNVYKDELINQVDLLKMARVISGLEVIK